MNFCISNIIKIVNEQLIIDNITNFAFIKKPNNINYKNNLTRYYDNYEIEAFGYMGMVKDIKSQQIPLHLSYLQAQLRQKIQLQLH